MGAVAESHMRKGFLMYEEMRQELTIYEEAVSHIRLCNSSFLNFLIYEENSVSYLQCIVLTVSSVFSARAVAARYSASNWSAFASAFSVSV